MSVQTKKPFFSRAIVALLTLALALTGLAAQPAAAADTAKVSGTGAGESDSFFLDDGIYVIDFAYTGATDLVDVWLMSSEYGEVATLAYDDAASGHTKRVFLAFEGEELWLDVDAEPAVEWSATVAPAAEPTSPVKSFSAQGTGLDTSGLYLLDKGTYTYTATYSGNHLADGSPFGIGLFALDLNTPQIVALVDEEESSGGTRAGSFTLEQASLVWIDPFFIWGQASWSVDVTVQVPKTLTATPTPKISGTAQVGKKLTASPGTWKPSGVKLTYQWLRDGKKISGATRSTYTLKSADKGKKISVAVTGKKTGYVTVTKTSAKTKAVKAGALAAKTPKISGTAQVGKKLTAKPGAWKPTGLKFTYQWYRGSSKIKGATKSTYTLKSADKGKKIKVKVTGKKSGYTTASKTSKATSTVKGAPAKPKKVSASAAPTSEWNCPASHPIKGNASSMIYHVPGGAYYSRTKPEECFSTRSAAEKAGYRASKR
ncbi:MAG: hypothetical protein IPJ61_03405 [Tessaracoccus sp.]|uniref:sunset domain-containing protein n=1 Tax=Tessaracoccus sp. TaxID=1971211 RepID=UPI001ECA6EBF|nr:hypothetical protein [Tessaracoccus sp.]MBK7820131.1 hypothetical protein [Tessaracoccus sp.]